MLFLCSSLTGNTDDCKAPKVIEALKDVKICQVECGKGDAHTTAVDSEGNTCMNVLNSVCVCVWVCAGWSV